MLPKDMSRLVDVFFNSLNDDVREEALKRMSPDGMFSDRNTFVQLLGLYQTEAIQREDLKSDDLDRMAVQVVALSSVFTRFNDHAIAYREGKWAERFGKKQESGTTEIL